MTHALDDRTAIVSSLLASMRYSSQATLDLEFRSGCVYRYFTVPRAIAEALHVADSKGAYFNRHLKDRFPYQRLG
jgi:hypothetical protein